MAFSVKLDDESEIENTSYSQKYKGEIKKFLALLQEMNPESYLILSDNEKPGREVKINQAVCGMLKKTFDEIHDDFVKHNIDLTLTKGEGSVGGIRKPYNSGDVKEALFAISLFLQRVYGKLPTIQEVEDFIDNELQDDCSAKQPVSHTLSCSSSQEEIGLVIALATVNYSGVKVGLLDEYWTDSGAKERRQNLDVILNFLEDFKLPNFTLVTAAGTSNQSVSKKDIYLYKDDKEIASFSLKGGHGQFSQLGGYSYIDKLADEGTDQFFEAFIDIDIVKKELEKIVQPHDIGTKENYVKYVWDVYTTMHRELDVVLAKVNYYVELSKSLVSLSTRDEELIILDINKKVKQINFKDILKLKDHPHTFSARLDPSEPKKDSEGLPIPKITISCSINGETHDILRLRFKVEWKGEVKRNLVEVLPGYFKMIQEI